MIIVGKALL